MTSIDTGAILDMKIDKNNLYAVDDRGRLTVYQLEQKNLEEKHKIDVSQGLLLSVSVRNSKVATSSSVGSISVVGKS